MYPNYLYPKNWLPNYTCLLTCLPSFDPPPFSSTTLCHPVCAAISHVTHTHTHP